MKKELDLWAEHYKNKKKNKLYPEGFVLRTLLSRFPKEILNQDNYKGSRILDLSCGYGRNLELLLNIGFEVYATEISEDILSDLKNRFSDVKFDTGFNHELPFTDNFFDYVLACNTCYYLEPETVFTDNLEEISRILKAGGIFIGSILGPGHSILKGGEFLDDGSVVVRDDPLGVRDGYRVQYAKNAEHLHEMLALCFHNCEIGSFLDEFCGFRRELFYFISWKK